jgi:hypothetical protein
MSADCIFSDRYEIIWDFNVLDLDENNVDMFGPHYDEYGTDGIETINGIDFYFNDKYYKRLDSSDSDDDYYAYQIYSYQLDEKDIDNYTDKQKDDYKYLVANSIVKLLNNPNDDEYNEIVNELLRYKNEETNDSVITDFCEDIRKVGEKKTAGIKRVVIETKVKFNPNTNEFDGMEIDTDGYYTDFNGEKQILDIDINSNYKIYYTFCIWY